MYCTSPVPIRGRTRVSKVLEHTENGNSPLTRSLSKLRRVGGEVREIILAHQAAGGREAARIVKVETGGVDRTTGQPLLIYFEVTVKLPRQPEVIHTFS